MKPYRIKRYKIVKSSGGASIKKGISCDVFFLKGKYNDIRELHYFPTMLKMQPTDVAEILGHNYKAAIKRKSILHN